MSGFWYFLFYGFCGYLLEKAFARLTRSPRRVRKGFLLAPVCPVYGLAMCAALALGVQHRTVLWEQILLCALVSTGMEYAVHWLCDTALHVQFWDYRATRMDVNGRICLPFSVLWGILGAFALNVLHPVAAHLAARIPTAVTNVVLLCLAIDALWSIGVLLRWGDVELLAPSALRRRIT